MNPPISSFMPSKYLTPVAFKTFVNGKKLIAEITEELDIPLDYTFLVKFGDGVTIEATLMENGNCWVSEPWKIDYAKAIAQELRDFVFVKASEWDKFDLEYKDQSILVWVSKDEGETDTFSVYYHGKYQFHVRRTKQGWEAKSVSVLQPVIDERLVAEICNRLDKAE